VTNGLNGFIVDNKEYSMIQYVVESVGFTFKRCSLASELLLFSISDKRLVCLVNLVSLLCASYKQTREVLQLSDSVWTKQGYHNMYQIQR
jgi:hypothetical protein